MITQNELFKEIKNFAQSISKQQLGIVYYRPDNDSQPTNCIENVRRFVEKNGGSIKYGWTFHHRISPQFGDYIFATHHAVWYAPNGNLIDITPFHEEEKHHPYTSNGSVLFLLDDNAIPIKMGKYFIPRPLRYFAIGENEQILKYMERLRENEAKDYKKKFGIKLKYKK